MGVAESRCDSPDIRLFFTFPSIPCSYIRAERLVPASECGWALYTLLAGLTLTNMAHDCSFLPLASQQGSWKPRAPGGIAQHGEGPPSHYQTELGGRNKPLVFLVTAA